MVSLETKLSVVPGRNFWGQEMADWVGVDIFDRVVLLLMIHMAMQYLVFVVQKD